jgi:hypothetical protein
MNRCQHQNPSGCQCRTPLRTPPSGTVTPPPKVTNPPTSPLYLPKISPATVPLTTSTRPSLGIAAWPSSKAASRPDAPPSPACIHSLLLRALPAIEQRTKSEDRRIVIDMERHNYDGPRVVFPMPRPQPPDQLVSEILQARVFATEKIRPTLDHEKWAVPFLAIQFRRLLFAGVFQGCLERAL